MAQLTALITNDDGIDSPGLHALARIASEAGLHVAVAAPERQSSGASGALSALADDGRMVSHRRELPDLPDIEAYAVQATPAFIVFVGCNGGFGDPDIVLSGINHGPNTGSAVTHSGTVGAAVTAVLQHRRALAVSALRVEENPDWTNCEAIVRPILENPDRIPEDVVVNINVPDVGPGEVKGTRLAPLAKFGAVQVSVRERGEGFISIAIEDVKAHGERDSDACLLAEGYATMTPLNPIATNAAVDLSALLPN